MGILLFVALALILITALDANLQPGTSRKGRKGTSGRRNPRRVTPRRRGRQVRGRDGLAAWQVWSS